MIKRVLFGFVAVCISFIGLAFMAESTSAGPSVIGGSLICSGSGQFTQKGVTYNASDAGVDEIKNKDTVIWQGAILNAPPGQQAYSGKIEVELPPPFGKVEVNKWSGTTDSTSNNGTKKYDIPGFVPANVEFEVKGSHTQGGLTCSGTVKVKLEGSVFGPFSLATAGLTLLAAIALVTAGLQQ